MPGPIGHALAGVSAAWATGPRTARSLTIACAILAAAPDIDVLFGGHRGPTHSVGALVIVAAAAAIFAAARRLSSGRIAVACSLAYASHLLLDWLGKDTAPPYGLMALWPLNSRYYASGADLFLEISRRYWKPDEFILGNLLSLGWELALLLPIAALAWWTRRRNTENRIPKTE